MAGRVCDCWRVGEMKKAPVVGAFFYWMKAAQMTGVIRVAVV